jgi:chondroitin sulfate synthase
LFAFKDVKFLEKIISSNHKPNQKILNIADGTDDLRPDIGDGGHVTLNVFRSADTSLVHIYHPIICDKHLDDAQYKMCLGTLGNTLGNHRLLENYFLHNKFILDYAKSSRASNMISNNLINNNNNNNREDERTL